VQVLLLRALAWLRRPAAQAGLLAAAALLVALGCFRAARRHARPPPGPDGSPRG